MTSYESQQKLSNEADPEMVRILEEMLEADETITARAVARKHPSINHASSVTRHPSRSALLAQFQSQQMQYRTWHARTPKRSREQLATQLAQKDLRITELEHQVEILRVHNLAMIRIVGEMGGISKLLKFYDGHCDVRNELNRLRAATRRGGAVRANHPCGLVDSSQSNLFVSPKRNLPTFREV